MNGSSDRYGISQSNVPDLLKENGYTLGIYKHDAQEFDTTAKIWGDVLALSQEGLKMLEQRLPNVRFISE